MTGEANRCEAPSMLRFDPPANFGRHRLAPGVQPALAGARQRRNEIRPRPNVEQTAQPEAHVPPLVAL
ncbi:MAG: hypothetical protein ACJ76Q_03225, partial [Solirubrobacteraceae bacterium]